MSWFKQKCLLRLQIETRRKSLCGKFWFRLLVMQYRHDLCSAYAYVVHNINCAPLTICFPQKNMWPISIKQVWFLVLKCFTLGVGWQPLQFWRAVRIQPVGGSLHSLSLASPDFENYVSFCRNTVFHIKPCQYGILFDWIFNAVDNKLILSQRSSLVQDIPYELIE